MKLPSFYTYKYDPEDGHPGIGIEWMLCREAPYSSIMKPDQEYYDYLHVIIKLVHLCINIDIPYKKMPYRNIEQYKEFRRINSLLERNKY